MSSLPMQRRDRRWWWLFPVAVALVPAAAAVGQQRTGQDLYEEQLRVRLDQQVPAATEIGFDAGGWFSFALFRYDDATAQRTKMLRRYQLRGWASVNVQGVHRAYVRGLLSYDDWDRPADNARSLRGDDFDEEIERAWYQFDFTQLMRNQTGKEPPVGFRFKVGREFATIGTALVLSIPLNMVQLEVTAGHWELMALLGKTFEDTRNIDDSTAVATHQSRCMWGVELAYTGFSRHRPFVYFLSQEDNTIPNPVSATQSYGYSSSYLGVGSRGALLLPNLRYQAELVWEWGKTYSNNVTAGRDNICAMAADVLLEYLFPTRMHPRVMVEYLFASGDSDRSTSATATAGGNLAGTDDHAFNAFGFRDTGLAFAPRLSNIHVYVLGASFFPLEHLELFRKMQIGSKLFFYHKSEADGPISDTTATNNAQYLGWEWDIYCDWRLTSDLSWTIRYGAFLPGSAYDGNDGSCRQFLFTGFVFSF